jgi:methionine sulfoxide reductase heme-binding subunit
MSEVMMLKKISPYWVWALLAIPALSMMPGLLSDTGREFHRLLHPSGEWAARLMILSMVVTPLMYLTKGAAWVRWLKTNRRYFGVAAFAYAAVHTYVYVVGEGTLAKILAEASAFDMWTGWAAFAVFIPLAATSMDLAVRKMGTWWKPLQRWTYAAAVLTLLHWASLHNWGHPAGAFVNFAPLIALTAYRLWWVYLRPRPAAMA